MMNTLEEMYIASRRRFQRRTVRDGAEGAAEVQVHGIASWKLVNGCEEETSRLTPDISHSSAFRRSSISVRHPTARCNARRAAANWRPSMGILFVAAVRRRRKVAPRGLRAVPRGPPVRRTGVAAFELHSCSADAVETSSIKPRASGTSRISFD